MMWRGVVGGGKDGCYGGRVVMSIMCGGGDGNDMLAWYGGCVVMPIMCGGGDGTDMLATWLCMCGVWRLAADTTSDEPLDSHISIVAMNRLAMNRLAMNRLWREEGGGGTRDER